MNQRKTRYLLAITVAVLVFPLAPQKGFAKFARPDLAKVPVDRLAKNIKQKIESDPRNSKLHLNLARLYAMSYALKTDEVEVNQRNSDRPWLGYTPPHVPFRLQETENEEKAKVAKERLQLAIEHYEKAISLDKKNLTAQLGLGWALQQSGNTMQATQQYRDTLEMGWQAEEDLKRAGLGFHSVTVEAFRYLQPLLDKEQDAEFIQEMNERVKKLQKIRRPVTPIAVALTEKISLQEIEARDLTIHFDADGTGVKKRWSWIHPSAGWLVHDQLDNGNIESALQMFGNFSFYCFWENGYQALAALDDNQNGFVEGAELVGLKIWRDANCNGISEQGEVRPLKDYRIVRLAVSYQRLEEHAEKIPFNAVGAETIDGRKLATFDVNLHQAEVPVR